MPKNHWDSLIKSFEGFDLEKFRENGEINDRLSSWSPVENSTRYYKALLYEFALYLDELIKKKNKKDSLLKKIEQIPKRNLGKPPTINFYGTKLSIDYLLAIEECDFCEDKLKNSKIVCEIGAGFGRSCHAILSLFNIEQYIIIDLPEMILISREYLSKVLNVEQYKKIKFVNASDFEKIKDVDIAINIASMQEMPPETVIKYLSWISTTSKYFFTKNAMGKYNQSDIDLEIKSEKEYKSVLEMGILRNTYPLYEGISREKAVNEYNKSYCPQFFKLIKDQRGFGQFYLFNLALFERDN